MLRTGEGFLRPHSGGGFFSRVAQKKEWSKKTKKVSKNLRSNTVHHPQHPHHKLAATVATPCTTSTKSITVSFAPHRTAPHLTSPFHCSILLDFVLEHCMHFSSERLHPSTNAVLVYWCTGTVLRTESFARTQTPPHSFQNTHNTSTVTITTLRNNDDYNLDHYQDGTMTDGWWRW